jgi:hypothetical protein
MDVDLRRAGSWLAVACAGVCAGLLCISACMQGEPASPGLGDASSIEDAGAEGAVVTGCPEGGYPACPTVMPSYGAQVRPIVDVWCAPCHFNGGSGTGKGYDFSTLAGLRGGLSTNLTDLHTCRMPPEDAAALSPANRETLIEWLVCDAPDN